jgi:hypothetical protein
LTPAFGTSRGIVRRIVAARSREAIMHRVDQLADLPCFRDQLEKA